jgi:thioredoxin 1
MDSRNDSEVEVTYEEFNEIVKGHEIVVVNFFAEWHMPCIMLTPVIEDLALQLKNVRFVKVNVDDNEELKDKHKVSTMPCVVIFKNGEEIARIIGNHAVDILEQKVKECLSC